MSEQVAVTPAPARHRRPEPPRPSAGDRARRVVRAFGEVLLTLGLVVLLFLVYEVYITNWFSAIKQREATAALEDRWNNPRGTIDRPIEGQGIAMLHIPAFGPDFDFTVLQGVGQDVLAIGPGHYVDTAMPGQPGNFAVAGHRVGDGAPFNDLDLLESCDAMVVETRDTWFVYRMLPTAGEMAGWSAGKGATPQCRGVAPLPEPYPEVPGREIVMPWQDEVIAPVPGIPELQLPPEQLASLITLTTCHPRFSAEQRMIIHGVLTAQYPKDGPRPPALTAG